MAWAIWAWLVPPLEQMQRLSWGWVLQLWARNLILMIFFAQGLHLWLYGWKKAGRRLQVRPARTGQECPHLPLERSILGHMSPTRSLSGVHGLDVL